MIAFEIPVSSSRLRKTKPLAVPGRWRAISNSSDAGIDTVRHCSQLPSRDDTCFVHVLSVICHECGPIVSPVPPKSATKRSSVVIGSNGAEFSSSCSSESRCEIVVRYLVLPARPPECGAAVMLFPSPVDAPAFANSVSSIFRIEGTRRLRSYSEANGPSVCLEAAIALPISSRNPFTYRSQCGQPADRSICYGRLRPTLPECRATPDALYVDGAGPSSHAAWHR